MTDYYAGGGSFGFLRSAKIGASRDFLGAAEELIEPGSCCPSHQISTGEHKSQAPEHDHNDAALGIRSFDVRLCYQ